jgi:AcrR family transcriptional regulator
MRARNPRKAKAGTPAYAEVKRRLVDAAIELMAERGFGKFRFEGLAAHIGCSRATIYRYFDSKQELMTEVMMTLMNEITNDVVQKTAGTRKVTRARFAEALHRIITDLQHNRRYAIVMDARNVETFARLSHERFSAITSTMLKTFMTDGSSGRVLKKGIGIPETVHWLQHQIVSYGFFGLQGKTDKEQTDYLNKMVASVILDP